MYASHLAFAMSAALVVGAAPITAQQPQTEPLQVGGRVRIYVDCVTRPLMATGEGRAHCKTRYVGTLTAMSATAFTLTDDESGESLQIQAADVGRFDVSKGLGRNTLKGAAVGAGLGLVAGVLVGLALDEPGSEVPASAWALVGGGVGTVMGGLTGAAVGTLFHSEKWREVPSSEWQYRQVVHSVTLFHLAFRFP